MQLFSVIPQALGKTSSPTFTGLTLSGLTETRVLFAGVSGVISDDAGLVYASGTGTLSATILNSLDEDNALQIDGTTVFKTGLASESNILIGEDAGLNLDSSGGGNDAIDNVYIGKGAGRGGVNSTAYKNVFIGETAARDITSGNENVGIGQNCLLRITSGRRNFAFGTDVMQNVTTGINNVGIGPFVMDIFSNPNHNVAIGLGALRYTGENDNVGIGYQAGHFGSEKYRNVYIGRETGYGVNGQSNSDNTFLGYRSGYGITTGSNGIFIGHEAGFNQTTNSNLLIIDNQDRGSAATELTDSLIYGIFSATPASQSLRFNVGTTTWHNATHEDTDGGRESIFDFKGQQSGGEETTLARIEIGHDGTGDDQLGRIIDYVNTGAGLVEARRLDSSLNASFAKIRLTAIGGFAVKLTNKTGGNTVAGQLVITSFPLGADTDDAFETATGSDANVIGVVLDAGVADGSEAWIVVAGIADVLMDGGGSARGDRIISSGTAGSADVWNVGGAVATHFLEIGHCIETRVGAGLARCILHFN